MTNCAGAKWWFIVQGRRRQSGERGRRRVGRGRGGVDTVSG